MGFTLGEIRGQFDALGKTIGLLDAEREKISSAVAGFGPKAILFTGCGSSFYISCSLRSIASTRLQLPVHALASGDLWLNCEKYRPLLEGALVVSVSRSGRTSEVLNAYKAIRALNAGTHFISVICDDDTPLEALSDLTLRMPWAFDESVCQTRCVSNMYAMGAMLIGVLAGDPSIRKGMEDLCRLGPDYIRRCEGLAQEIAQRDWDHAVVLADGEIDGLATEAALAYKEISQLNSNYYHLLDVRHGPMVLIGKKTLVLVSVKSPACPYEMALVDDVLATGATAVCCSQKPLDKPGAINVALGEDIGLTAGGMGLLVFCQLVAYYKSKIVGCDPDHPDGLDPWINLS